MLCSKYIFASSIANAEAGMQLRQSGDRWISVPPDYHGTLSLSWTTEGLKITMHNAVCYVRTGEKIVRCDSAMVLPWHTEGAIFLLEDDAETVFAQICISKTDDPAVWSEYKKTIMNEEARIISDIQEQEYYFWQALSSEDLSAPYGLLEKKIVEVEDIMRKHTGRYDVAALLARLKHLQYKYSVRLLNVDGQSESSLDRLACEVRALMVSEKHKSSGI